MDQDSVNMVAASKVPMLKPGVKTTISPTTAEEKAQRRLELKGRSILLMGILNEHQLKFNSIKDAKSLLLAIEKRLEVLDQTFDRLQKLISQLEIHGESILQEDVNQKFLRSLSPKWNTHTIVWRNKPKIDTISLDDLYNNLKIYKPEVKGTSSLSTQNVAFVSSNNTNSTNRAVNTAYGAITASTQATLWARGFAYLVWIFESGYHKLRECMKKIFQRLPLGRGDVRTLMIDEAHASRYLVHSGVDKTYYDLKDMYGGHVWGRILLPISWWKTYFEALVDIAEGIENTAKTCVRLIILKQIDKVRYISKIIETAKSSKHRTRERNSTREAKDSKPKPEKVNSQSTSVNYGSTKSTH
ncbi:hypothetical protein Tco_0190901 [Tanacetum coccineum]